MYPYIHIGPIQLGTYGICAAIGAVASYLILRADLARHQYRKETAATFVVITSLVGIAGAKIYYLLETPHSLHGGLFKALTEPNGLSWLGGLTAGTVTICLLRLPYGIPLLTMLDLAAPVGAIAYGFGRLGCLMAGDGDYGTPTSLPWGMSFPHGTVPTFERVHPTPIYEAAFSFVLCWALWKMGKRSPAPGKIAGTYLIISGAARFAVEFIKLNPKVYFGLTNSQVVSLVSILAGALILIIIRGRAPVQPANVTAGLNI
ncbi:MAG TPA: prolipoprotein diacylglyceryl transferase [Blastocatellia bacterium]